MNDKAKKRLESALAYIERARVDTTALRGRELDKFCKRFGASVACAALQLTSVQLDERRAADKDGPTMGDSSTDTTRALARVTRRCTVCLSTLHTTATHDSGPVTLQHDDRLAVPLITLAPGSRFKTPDSPDEGLRGKCGTLISANDCRARVRFEKAASTFAAKRVDRATGEEYDVELTFERSGETDIAARTYVVPLSTSE